MSKEELKLLGLPEESVKGILDAKEKVAKLEEEISKEMEPSVKKWEAVRRESLEEASRLFLP